MLSTETEAAIVAQAPGEEPMSSAVAWANRRVMALDPAWCHALNEAMVFANSIGFQWIPAQFQVPCQTVLSSGVTRH